MRILTGLIASFLAAGLALPARADAYLACDLSGDVGGAPLSKAVLEVMSGALSGPAVFLFASTTGTVSGWSPAVSQNTAQTAFTSTDGANRVEQLRTGSAGLPKLDSTTVLDDGARDVIAGNQDLDWFFASDDDQVIDRGATEQLN